MRVVNAPSFLNPMSQPAPESAAPLAAYSDLHSDGAITPDIDWHGADTTSFGE